MFNTMRKWLWRRGLRYSGKPGWEDLVREVSSVDLWQKDGLFGLPLEWTLLERGEDRVVRALDGVCSWSGVAVNGGTPLIEQPDGSHKHDLSKWGVRCARCGVVLHCHYAGMKYGNSVPSCPPCRSVVRAVIAGG